MRVLVVEDDPRVGSMLNRALARQGYAVDLVERGDEGLRRATGGDYDALVLDVMLPGLDGFSLCRSLRRREVWTPVLMLTARKDVVDRVSGLDSGADDYLPKPFALQELLARLRALTRRANGQENGTLCVDDLVLDPAAHEVRRGEVTIELTPKEFALLQLFMEHAGRVLTRETILEAVWDFAYEAASNIVDQYVRYLRDKVDRPFGRTSIETVRGVGYRMRKRVA
ncbi:MAG: response regulator transcription factor [Actinomycetota bacterium]